MKLVLILFIFSFYQFSFSKDLNPSICGEYYVKSNIFFRKWKESLKGFSAYKKELKEYGIKRIFIKPRKLGGSKLTEDETKFFTLMYKVKPQEEFLWFENLDRKVFQFLPRRISKFVYKEEYEFSLNNAIYRKIESNFVNNNWELSIPTKIFIALPPTLLVFGTAYYVLEYFEDEQEKEKFLEEVSELIKRDFRFQDIKADLEKGKLTEEKAIEQAIARVGEYNLYFEVMNSLDQKGLKASDKEVTTLFINDPNLSKKLGALFKRVWSYNNESFWNKKNFLYSSNKKLDSDEVHLLFLATHKKLYLQEKMRAYLVNKEKGTGIFKDYLDDNYVKNILELEKKGVSKDKILFYLMDDIEWNSRFSEWEILGVKPLAYDENNKITGEVLTTEMIRKEMLLEINDKSN